MLLFMHCTDIHLAEKEAHDIEIFASYLSERYRSARLLSVLQVDWQGHGHLLSFIYGSLPHLQPLPLL